MNNLASDDVAITPPDINTPLIKSKRRVQKHGEVFTPTWMVNKMLDTPGIKEACETLEATFLEPGAGEGAFLVEILKRKLTLVTKLYNNDILTFENHALFTLTTLYGIELLEDNAQICTMNLYRIFDDFYHQAIQQHGAYRKPEVLSSAMVIIATNICQGNFLTKEKSSGKPIIITEWKSPSNIGKVKTIQIDRTEYTLDEIQQGITKPLGTIYSDSARTGQMSLFMDFSGESSKESPKFEYVRTKISNVHKEEKEMREQDGD